MKSPPPRRLFRFFQLSGFYLVVKRSVGRFLHRRLFLLVSDLDHHAGVDVFSHQLPALRHVNGNLSARAKRRVIFLAVEIFAVFFIFRRGYLEALRFAFAFLDASFQLGPGKVSQSVQPSSLRSGAAINHDQEVSCVLRV